MLVGSTLNLFHFCPIIELTQISWILTECERHFLENGQENVSGGSVGHDLCHGRRQHADYQVDHPNR